MVGGITMLKLVHLSEVCQKRYKYHHLDFSL